MLNKIIHHLIEFVSAHWHAVFLACLSMLLLTFFIAMRRPGGGRKNPGKNASDKKSDGRQNTAASALRRLPPEIYRVYQELYVPRLDGKGVTRIAYVVAARHGIFAVQPQREVGLVSGAPGDRVWTSKDAGAETTFTNPVIRSAYHARSLARHLGLPEALICPLVLFDQEVVFSRKPPANVLTSGLRSMILSHQAELLSAGTLSAVLQKLDATAADTGAREEYETYRRSKGRRARRSAPRER